MCVQCSSLVHNCPSILIRSWPMWHYPMCCLVFLSWFNLHYTYWSLDTHISFIQSLILRRFYGVTSFSRYPLVEIILYDNQDGICFLWDLGLWILTIQPSHSYTLACCRPIHLILLNFKILTTIWTPHHKKLFFPLQLL
jgi:hypothetical protein